MANKLMVMMMMCMRQLITVGDRFSSISELEA